EMKELARVTLSGAGFVKDAPIAALAANAYPKKPYFKELSTLALEVDLKGKKLRDGTVYLLQQSALASDASSEIRTSQAHVQAVLTHIDEGSGGWTSAGRPGVKDAQYFRSARTIGTNKGNAAPSETL